MSSSSANSPVARLTDAVARVSERLSSDELAVSRLGDDDLLAFLSDATEARKALELMVAAASAEVSRRSSRELGYSGLAQRRGLRTGNALVQQVTGLGRADVTRAVRAGEELAPMPPVCDGRESTTDAVTPLVPVVPDWLGRLRDALASGRVSQAQFHAIRTGLGEPPVERYPDLDDDFLPAAWNRAVVILLDEASTRTVEDLRDQSRIARDRLDPIGVTLRFEERFAARSFRKWTDPETGQHHAHIAFDDDASAWVDAVLRAALRPRRGPRFVGAEAADKTRAAVDDERTNEQLQYDTIVAILRTGANADPTQAFGDRQPGVRIIVAADALVRAGDLGETRATTAGHLEDGGQAVPPGIIEKYLCDAGAVPVIRDEHGRPLDLGREARLFTRKQRIAIAARDGGCVWTGCDRPPSECEYHHIDHWWEDHGRTDVADGVPLCRNCHMRLHNQGWRITRRRHPASGDESYWLHPPPDPATGELSEPTELPSKSPLRFTAA